MRKAHRDDERALPLSYRPVEVGAGWDRTSDHARLKQSNPMLTAL